MSNHPPYWVSIDFSTDHCIVSSARNPAFYPDYDDRYFAGPYPTLTEAKEHIRTACWSARESISSKLNYWVERTVADIPIVTAD